MFCPKCSSDNWSVIKKYSFRRFVEGKGWVYSDEYDTRRLLCNNCMSVFLVESKIVFKEEFDELKHKKRITVVHKSPFDEDAK